VRLSWFSFRSFAILVVLAAIAGVATWHVAAQENDAKRDAWQRPDEVMDLLALREGSSVADVGCGDGYFVMHLARRVSAAGAVYAVDVDEDALDKLRRKAERAEFTQVHIVRSQADDPKLPAGSLDAVLVVNAYHEMRQYDAMMRAFHAALKPGGRLAIIDAPGDARDPRKNGYNDHTIARQLVREDAERAGFRFRSEERGFERPESSRRNWFFYIFEKPQP
jgi:predicted methyltransferase